MHETSEPCPVNGESSSPARPARPKRQKKSYTDCQKAEALAVLDANGGRDSRKAIYKTAKQLGIPDRTLRDWSTAKHTPKIVLHATHIKTVLADRIETLLDAVVGEMSNPDRIQSAPYSALVSALTSGVQTMRLLREQPTTIGSTLSPDALSKRLSEIAQQARTLAAIGQAKQPPAPTPDPSSTPADAPPPTLAFPA